MGGSKRKTRTPTSLSPPPPKAKKKSSPPPDLPSYRQGPQRQEPKSSTPTTDSDQSSAPTKLSDSDSENTSNSKSPTPNQQTLKTEKQNETQETQKTNPSIIKLPPFILAANHALSKLKSSTQKFQSLQYTNHRKTNY